MRQLRRYRTDAVTGIMTLAIALAAIIGLGALLMTSEPQTASTGTPPSTVGQGVDQR